MRRGRERQTSCEARCGEADSCEAVWEIWQTSCEARLGRQTPARRDISVIKIISLVGQLRPT